MQNIKEIMIALEQALRSQDQWQQQPPPQQALASNLPFCYDTLEFNQWLQWVFVPRINTLIESNSALPAESAIYEYAEEVYKGAEYSTGEILQIIKLFDQMILVISQSN